MRKGKIEPINWMTKHQVIWQPYFSNTALL